jgi:phospholipase C
MRIYCSLGAAAMVLLFAVSALSQQSTPTTTPIKHVIVVIGENRSFDNLFATFQPADTTQHVWNLLSQGIVTASGGRGPNFDAAVQHEALDTASDGFLLSPPQTVTYTALPQPSTTEGDILFAPAKIPSSLSFLYGKAITNEPGLAAADQNLLNDGGLLSGVPPLVNFVPDIRFPKNLLNGPFQITSYVRYSDTTGDPMHRFYQNWQQLDCSANNISSTNPSGCAADLFPWVATTVGWGPLINNTPPTPTFMGGVAMGFYNMSTGDVPYFASLANEYALSDNYHQFLPGGTGPNSISIGTAAPLVFSDANGNPAKPLAGQVENPNAYPGTNNWYRQEGYAILDSGNTSNASYTNCSDSTQPGVAPIMNFLDSLPYKPFNSGNCAPGEYYLLNNQLPSYERDGTLRADKTYTVGPSSVPTIGDKLSAAGVSWKYYGEGFTAGSPLYSHYCDICNPFQYSKSIMTTSLKNNIQDLDSFYTDLDNGTLPAVSFIKPDDILDGHPGTSLVLLYEAFVRNIVGKVQAQNATWNETAIFITTDESGALYDSGYIQPIDFFGDGPRIMMLAVSPFARKHYIDHAYGDHASLLKFIETNWRLKPLSASSRDNLPNPVSSSSNPYVPTNSPAVGDLMTMFDFTTP